jgi:ATP-dependent DNA helicase PIF1
MTRLNQLTTEEQTFDSIDCGEFKDMNQRKKMLASFVALQRLTLRVGAQVMLIKNVDEMLVNGTMGKVLRFIDPGIYGTPDDPEVADGAFGRAPLPTAGGGVAKNTATDGKRYPFVEFFLRNGIKKRMLVMPETWRVELPSGEIQVSRTQVYLLP